MMQLSKKIPAIGLGLLLGVAACAQIGNGTATLEDSRLMKRSGWKKIILDDAAGTRMGGIVGAAYRRAVDRLARKPYTPEWLLADVTFRVKRIFTNYSGDVSGRFIELGALLSTTKNRYPAETLPVVLKEVLHYQQPDGHFGVQVDPSRTLKANDAVVTLLWGNARMLVGLVTAWERFRDEQVLRSARSLGDFYVNTAAQLCNPEREGEYKATGTAADSYQVGYFPAMEGLVLLYEATRDARYLDLAERMAAFFLRFDGLPLNHSHGNLSAWRSILELYRVTGKNAYLLQAIGKWKDAVKRGYVWSIGGVGEHWYIDYRGSEGCSESDWLRFNLDLWRFTGQTAYLDMAERLLENQYVADQSGNGGFGMRHFDVIKDTGPVATSGGVNEWDFCCSFHGPLGLYFFKRYLASASGKDIFINFPYSFSTQLNTGNAGWEIDADTDSLFDQQGKKRMRLRIRPLGGKKQAPVNLYLRVPVWTGKVTLGNAGGSARIENGYLLLKRHLTGRAAMEIVFEATPFIEARKFVKMETVAGSTGVFKDVSLVLGAQLMYAYPARSQALLNLLVLKDRKGRLKLLQDADGTYTSIQMPGPAADKATVIAALQTAEKVALKPWPVPGVRRTAFSYNLVVIPESGIPEGVLQQFKKRPRDHEVPHYACHLEKNKEFWPDHPSWKFNAEGIHITGGDVGLIEGNGYKNYRFGFDLVLPPEGQGISGWVVRAKDADNYLLLQLQSADSKYHAPQYKTKKNTLRILPRINGTLSIEDPVVLETEIRTGETHHIVTECVDEKVTVFIDGREAATYRVKTGEGPAGFRVGDSIDQGVFKNICLKKIP